jgi:hypothetical protein
MWDQRCGLGRPPRAPSTPVATRGTRGRVDQWEGTMMSRAYKNRYGRVFYVHAVRRPDGRLRYVMQTRAAGGTRLPAGFEIRENVHGRVTVRRVRPRRFNPLEEQLLLKALEQFRPFAYELDIDGRAATVYASAEDRRCFLESLDAEFAEGFAEALTKALAKRFSPELIEMFRARRKQQNEKRPRYYPLLRFVIVDRRERRFAVERVCFTGESSWIRLEILRLPAAVMKYLPHLGRDSFFDLI